LEVREGARGRIEAGERERVYSCRELLGG